MMCAKFFATGHATAVLPALKRCHDMQALAAGGLAERFQAGCLESIADFDGAGDDRIESNIRRRIQIEDQAAGDFGIAGRAVPGMKLERSDLCGRSERLDAIDLHVWRLVAAHLDGREKVRHAGRSVALKELFGADTIRQPDQRAGATLEMRQHPLADVFVVAREVDLGEGRTGHIRPQRLVGF